MASTCASGFAEERKDSRGKRVAKERVVTLESKGVGIPASRGSLNNEGDDLRNEVEKGFYQSLIGVAKYNDEDGCDIQHLLHKMSQELAPEMFGSLMKMKGLARYLAPFPR